MRQKKAQTLLYGPQLVFEERSFECGYAPRALHVSTLHDNTVFVGCKDGSVSVVTAKRPPAAQAPGAQPATGLRSFSTRFLSTAEEDGEAGTYRGAVYALCEWDREHLLVARRGRGLSLLRWDPDRQEGGGGRPAKDEPRAEEVEVPLPQGQPGSPNGPIRCLLRLDANRIAVVCRDSGVVVLGQEPGRVAPLHPTRVRESPRSIRSILPLHRRDDPQEPSWFLLTDRGDFFRWDGRPDSPPEKYDDFWPGGRRPSLIADSCLLPGKDDRAGGYSAPEFILATDRALYLFSAQRSKNREWELCHERIALSGLNATAMALSYAYAGAHEYLWITDLRGDSHLFWREGGDSAAHRSFLRSGVVHPRSETVLSALLPQEPPEGDSFFVVQVRRDDRVVLGHYWTADPDRSSKDLQDLSLRKLLYLGQYEGKEGSEAVRAYLSRRGAGVDTEDGFKERNDAAVVAELFEYLAEDESRRRILLESLRAPYSKTVQKILQDGAKERRGEVGERESAGSLEASRLWAFVLLGVIHRAPDDQSSSYLGLLRWLRHRQVELLEEEGFERLVSNIDVHLLFARKWGLRGEVNRHREDLIEPQKSLAGQERALSLRRGKRTESDGIPDEILRLRLERLTYQAELFSRCVNLICEDERGRRLRGRTAWATAVLPGAPGSKRALVAVSWMWGGIELLELEAGGDRRPRLTFLYGDGDPDFSSAANPHVLKRARPEPSVIAQEKYGYSRIIHLGRLGGHPYLLSAPASEPGGRVGARLLIWPLEFGAEHPETIAPTTVALTEVGAESIYSLLELADGRLVAGLSGDASHPSLTLIRIQRSDDGFVAQSSVHRLAVDSAGAASLDDGDLADPKRRRNRVWALAKLPCEDEAQGVHRIALGCDSGDILEVEISWPEEESSDGAPSLRKVQLIGRLGSPVQVLACSSDSAGVCRIFAGGEDGAILAWQELSSLGRQGPRFGTLWATTEQGPISDVHLLGGAGGPGDSLVLVVTREGRYVVFDNRDKVPPVTQEDSLRRRPARVPLPGTRHGRRSLRCGAFASSLIQWREDFQVYSKEAKELGAFAALLVASGDGQLRLVSLHSPDYTGMRKRQHRSVIDLWQSVLRKPVHLRLTEAIYKASPATSLTLVRFLLSHDRTDPEIPPGGAWSAKKTFEEAERSPWCLPRHVRPLLRLRSRWDELREGGTEEPAPRTLEGPLSAALERSWRLNDPDLFKEICQVALRRANEDLYRAGLASSGRSGGREAGQRQREIQKNSAHFAFTEVLRAIELALPRWLGSERQEEAKVRIAVAKHLVDGDTFWVLQREVARELSSGASSKRYGDVLAMRIRAVRELVNKRHPLVSLESLRAANMSLSRLCRRLIAAREAHRRAGEPSSNYHPPRRREAREDCEARWDDVFQPYFEDLTAAAARTFRTPLELNDAMAHEYSRTFALCICACPSATLRMAARLSEQQLVSAPQGEQGLAHRVLVQLRILGSIGLEVPSWAADLFRLGTQPPHSGWNPAEEEGFGVLWDEGVFALQEGARRLQCVRKLGGENESDLGSLERLHGLLRELVLLSEKLETTAEGIDLSQEWLDGLKQFVEGLSPDYRDSQAFWRSALDRPGFVSRGAGREARKVRPEVIRLCGPLEIWAESCLKDLDVRARTGRLFQPEITTFSRVLRRLAEAAREFPHSAAVQTNVVQGVLGHHLLEDLDEHALELEEIAEVLNPRQVWAFRDDGRRRREVPPGDQLRLPSSERFASYLLGLAQAAESLPKNLRSLLALLRSAEEPGGGRAELSKVLEPFTTAVGPLAWKAKGRRPWPALSVSSQDARYLTLSLSELDQNQRKHSWPPGVEPLKAPELEVAGAGVSLDFYFAVGAKDAKDPNSNLSRLRRLEELGLEAPINPNESRVVASSGTGFYLASLAAAIAGWQLAIVAVEYPLQELKRVGRFRVQLDEVNPRRKEAP